MSVRYLAALLALTVTGTAMAACTWITAPVAPLERVAAGGEYLLGSMKMRGEERPGSLRVEKTQEGGNIQYHLTLRVDPPPHVGGRPVVVQASLFTQEAVCAASADELRLDLRRCPSNGRTVWHFQLAEDGSLASLCLHRKGFLGLGCRKIHADFTPARVSRFDELHAD